MRGWELAYLKMHEILCGIVYKLTHVAKGYNYIASSLTCILTVITPLETIRIIRLPSLSTNLVVIIVIKTCKKNKPNKVAFAKNIQLLERSNHHITLLH
jgi:hypothetical protein